MELGMVPFAWNPSTWEAGAGRSYKGSLGYRVRPRLNRTKIRRRGGRKGKRGDTKNETDFVDY